jgi:hypothetical protein
MRKWVPQTPFLKTEWEGEMMKHVKRRWGDEKIKH